MRTRHASCAAAIIAAGDEELFVEGLQLIDDDGERRDLHKYGTESLGLQSSATCIFTYNRLH